MYYAFNLVKAKDKNGVMRVLGYLATTHRYRAYDDPFLHTLVRAKSTSRDPLLSYLFIFTVDFRLNWNGR